MNSKILRTWGLALAATLAAFGAQAEGPLHGRISHDEGGMMVKGASGSDWSHATTNAIVLPGDTLWIDETGVGEVELPQGSFLRLADSSKIEVVSISPTTALRAWSGSFYVQRLSRSSGNVVLDTPAASVSIQPDSSVRVDVLTNGDTTVSVRWGRAEVRTNQGGSVVLTGGQRSYIDAGLLPSDAVPFDPAAEDAFDAWSRERAEYLATGGSTPVPPEVSVAPATIGVSDLNNYGEWVYVDQRPLWRPTVVTNYVPYRTGYWSYVPGCGHVWVASEPFGYVTSHYGRWNHYDNYGWCWSYDPVWRPAWAVTVRYGDYYAWSPCDYYGRPVLVGNSSHFNLGGVQFSMSSMSYVRYNELYYGPHYVNPWRQDVFSHYNNGPDTVININVWNIDSDGRGGGGRPVVNPYENDDRISVRDYAPERSIRGVSTIESGGRSAVERVQRLEQGLGRTDFTAVSRSRGGEARATDGGAARQAVAARSVRVERKGETSFSRADSQDPRSRGGEATTIDANGNERGSVRSLNRVQGESNTEGRTRGETVNPRGEGSVRGDTTTREGTSVRGEGRTPASETTRGEGRGRSETSTEREARIDMNGVAPVTGTEQTPVRGGVREGGSTVVRPRSEGSTTTQPTRTSVPQQERGTRSVDSPRATPTPSVSNERNVERSRTTVRPTESGGRTSEPTNRREYTQPVQAPRSESRQRESAPAISQPRVSQPRVNEPRVSEPRVSQPRVSEPAPRVERSAPAQQAPSRRMEYSAPSTRSERAPSQREMSAPRVQQPAVQQPSEGRSQRNSYSIGQQPETGTSGRGAVSVRPRLGEGSNGRGR
jgi:hypothetical protein